MTFVLAILGMIGSMYLIHYRETVGDMLGEADWMRKIGGVYNFVFLFGVFAFFWCIAWLTGTTTILFKPILWILPGLRPEAPPTF